MSRDFYRVTGAEEVAATFKRFGFKAADLQDAFREIAADVAAQARARAPRQSGRLASDVRPGIGKTRATVYAGGSAVPYAGVQEYGWPRRSIAAQPFLRPAADDEAEAAAAAIVKEMTRLINSLGLD